MKNFTEWLILEAESIHNYGEWGIIHPDGHIISGNKHRSAEIHDDLYKSALKKEDKKNPHNTIRKNHFAAYSQDNESGHLNIRTQSRTALQGAAKAYHNLPHTPSETVSHDHFRLGSKGTGISNTVGSKARMYTHIRKMANREKE